MTFRKVELVAVECDTCGLRGPASSRDHYAEQLAADAETPILPLRLVEESHGRHVCVVCRKAIAKAVGS
jgi:hypothetical protein